MEARILIKKLLANNFFYIHNISIDKIICINSTYLIRIMQVIFFFKNYIFLIYLGKYINIKYNI